MLGRGLLIRRADEMEQSAATLTELGIEPLMTNGTVARQHQLGTLGRAEPLRGAKQHGGAAMLAALNKATKI